jgi:titin
MHSRFQCQVTAEPEPSLAWFYNGQQLTSTPRIHLTFDKTTTTLTITGATVEDTGEYLCKATNSLGEASTKTFLRVRRK